MTIADRASDSGAMTDRAGNSRSFQIAGTVIEAAAATPGLHVVATPIGNLGDVTIRALEILAGADLIACEDTRVTRRLLDRYGISNHLISYHDRNGARVRPALMAKLEAGQSIALVSDAGTPLVSDPGYKLVRGASDAGYAIFPLPGASSVLAALVASGLPSDRFMFAGFLPNRKARRRAGISGLAGVRATLVFFESARRLSACLDDLAGILGPRDAAVVREITKKFEQTVRLPLDRLADHYRDMPAPKGEIVIVVGPPQELVVDNSDVDSLLREALIESSVRGAAARVAKLTHRPRRELYARAVILSKDARTDEAED